MGGIGNESLSLCCAIYLNQQQPHYFGWGTQNFHWGVGGTQNFGWGGTAWGSNSHMLSRICCFCCFFHLRGHKFDKKN